MLEWSPQVFSHLGHVIVTPAARRVQLWPSSSNEPSSSISFRHRCAVNTLVSYEMG